MNQKGKALLLIGSAKKPHSNSESLGTYLLERLKEHGFEAEGLFLHKGLKSDSSIVELLEAIDKEARKIDINTAKNKVRKISFLLSK